MKKEELKAMSHQELVEVAYNSETMCDIYQEKCNEMEKMLNGIDFQLNLLHIAIKNIVK